MKKILGIILDTIGRTVALLAVLPFAVGWIFLTYWMYKFFQSEGVMLPSIAWNVMALGFASLMFVILILTFSIMESFVKECKKLGYDLFFKRKTM